MTLRNQFYYAMFIQWLTHHGILKEWMDNFDGITGYPIGHYGTINRAITRIAPDEGTRVDSDHWRIRNAFYRLSVEDRQAINLESFIEAQSRKRDVYKRFMPYVSNFRHQRLYKPDHPLDSKMWSTLCYQFYEECINNKLDRVGLPRIKRALRLSGVDV